MAAKSNSIDMIHGPLWGKILKFTVTFIITAFLQQLYNAADVIVVGRFAGQKALAGVGTCSSVVNLFLNFILGLSAGTTIVIGQAIGARNVDEIEKTTHTSMAAAICGGFLISVICLSFTKPLLNMIDVPSDVMPEASTYLRIIAIGFVPSLIYNFGSSILRAKGDTKRPLYIVTASGLINVLLNLFFVCVLKMGAGGVAIATVISQIFTAVAILYILCNEHDETRIDLLKIRFCKKPFLKILKLGLPSGIQSSVYNISNMLVQSSINSFGSAAIAGSAAVSSVTDFYNAMANGLYQAALVFVSQNFGAKEFGRIKKVIGVCITYVFGVWAIQVAISAILGESILGLYLPNDPAAMEMAMRKFSILGIFYGVLGFTNVMSGVLRGMGASLINMIMSITGVCGVRIVWILTAFKAIGTFESLFVCYPLSWTATFIFHSIMFVIVYKKEKKRAGLSAA